jgi:putative ABC transport system permease protein
MDFIPIISTLRRHRTASILIILEIAFTCAIVCNAVFVIRQRLALMDRDSGIAESEIVRIQIAGIGKKADPGVITRQDLEALKAVSGVKDVAVTNMVPFGGSSWNTSVSTIPEDPQAPINVATYMGSRDLLGTLGVKLIAGRNFTPEEYLEYSSGGGSNIHVPSILITKGVAERMYPGQNAVGKPLYVWGKDPSTIVGIIDTLARPNDFQGAIGITFALVMPLDVDFTVGGNYLIRCDPARKAEVLAAAEAALKKVDPVRLVMKRQTFADIRKEHFTEDRAMAWILGIVSISLLVITALGVIGLASFWVQQRTRQIGVRRALGATRGDILRYFQTENFILATAGIVLGMALAYGINLWLMGKYQVDRLPFEFLPIGAGLLWFLGQVAVLGPALRAAAIPPAIATRSV